jgi:parvulin-like peptidyl-prolyl isomerase
MLKRTTVLGVMAIGVAAMIPLRAEVIEQVLVKVNGEIVTMGEFEKRQLAELQSKPELARLPANSPEIKKAVEESAPTLILSAVDELLLLQRAKEHGWVLGDDKYKEIVANLRKENNLENDDAFKKALEAEGMTESDLRKSIERDILIRQVTQADVTDKVSVSDQEIQAYYDAHMSEFTSPTEVTLRELLIPIPTTNGAVNVAQSDEIEKKAEEVHKRLEAGESFAKVAAEVSASQSKTNGGLVGPLRLEDLNANAQQLISSLKIGGLSPVLRTPQGFQILLLESRSESKVRTVKEARNDVYVKLAQQKSRGETFKYLDQLREQANIVWHQDELKKAYEKALAERRAALARGDLPQRS